MRYEKMLVEAAELKLLVIEKPMPPGIKGLYADNVIFINQDITTRMEKLCALTEEIGHHFYTYGDILDQNEIRAQQQELKARCWGYEKIIPLSEIVRAYEALVKGKFEIAEYLGVTEEFLEQTINRYRDRYGLYAPCGDKYLIYFDPLDVSEKK